MKTDPQIIQAILEGGRNRERATQHLMKSHIGFVHSISSKLSMDIENVRDCFIDALTDFVEQAANNVFQEKCKISTYIYRMMYFRCVDFLRKKKLDYVDLGDEQYKVIDKNSVEKRLMVEESVGELKKEMSSLGSPCKEILLDWSYWGYTMQEIADRYNLGTAKIAKNRKYQCLKKLMQKLGGIKKSKIYDQLLQI